MSAEKKVFRSKGIVERNLPRWFRKPGFKAWDDFLAYFRALPADTDAAILADWKDLDEKGDEADRKALLRLMKHYNKHRRFSKTEVAPPWFFVETHSRTDLPADDAWTVDLANNLDHERGQQKAAPRPAPAPRAPRAEGEAAAPAEGEAAAAPAAEGQPGAGPAIGVVPPPSTDKGWGDALRRLPGAIQLLVDGRGKNVSELNDRRRKAVELVQLDRIHNLSKHGAEIRKELLEWFAEKKRDAAEVEAEIKKRVEAIDAWVKTHLEAAKAKVPNLDAHGLDELKGRIRRLYPRLPDEAQLTRLAKQALDAAKPKKLESWAKKVLDDFNNSRGSAAEKVRDPRLIDGLLRWLSMRSDQDTPTDGDIYDQIQKLGGPNMAARKKRQEGPRPPKQQEKRDVHPNEADPDDLPAPAAKGKGKAPAPAGAPAAAPAAPGSPAGPATT